MFEYGSFEVERGCSFLARVTRFVFVVHDVALLRIVQKCPSKIRLLTAANIT